MFLLCFCFFYLQDKYKKTSACVSEDDIKIEKVFIVNGTNDYKTETVVIKPSENQTITTIPGNCKPVARKRVTVSSHEVI